MTLFVSPNLMRSNDVLNASWLPRLRLISWAQTTGSSDPILSVSGLIMQMVLCPSIYIYHNQLMPNTFVERYKLDSSSFNPNATPYRAGCPIDSIPPATIDELDKWFVQRRDDYRSLVGWSYVACYKDTSWPCAPVVSFLASYNSCPAAQHWEAAKYVVRYLRSTVEHGIAYHSASSTETSAYVHFPFPHDKEAYSDAVTPTKVRQHARIKFFDRRLLG